MADRIKQAVALVVTENKKYWIRLSRAYMSTLIPYWRKQSGFRYMKIYEIKNYKKGSNHAIGLKIGYITLNGSAFNVNGLHESTESLNFKTKHNLSFTY